MPDAEAMLDSLPKLSAQDLRALHDRCAVLLALSPTPAKSIAPDDFGQNLYDALCDELNKRTQTKCPPYHIFLRSGSGKRYEQAALLTAAAHRQWYRTVSAAQLISVCRMYAELMLDYLAASSLPAIWPTITWAVSNLPVIVDTAYPGYAASGLLDMVQALRTQGGAMPPT